MTTEQTPSVPVIDNRDATKKDAVILGQVYRAMFESTKSTTKAIKAVAAGWLDIDQLVGLRTHRDATQATHDSLSDKCWALLNGISNGTNYRGATPQTVALQFFNRNMNRNLVGRLSASDAKGINKVAFGL